MIKAMACIFIVTTVLVHSVVPPSVWWIPVHVIASFFIARWLIKTNSFPSWIYKGKTHD